MLYIYKKKCDVFCKKFERTESGLSIRLTVEVKTTAHK